MEQNQLELILTIQCHKHRTFSAASTNWEIPKWQWNWFSSIWPQPCASAFHIHMRTCSWHSIVIVLLILILWDWESVPGNGSQQPTANIQPQCNWCGCLAGSYSEDPVRTSSCCYSLKSQPSAFVSHEKVSRVCVWAVNPLFGANLHCLRLATWKILGNSIAGILEYSDTRLHMSHCPVPFNRNFKFS